MQDVRQNIENDQFRLAVFALRFLMMAVKSEPLQPTTVRDIKNTKTRNNNNNKNP